MELYDQIRRISFVFFWGTGLAHFLSGLLYVNGYGAPESGVVNRVLFIPFVVAALTYAFSNLKFHLAENGQEAPWMSYGLAGVGVTVFIILIFIELFVVDSPCPLTAC